MAVTLGRADVEMAARELVGLVETTPVLSFPELDARAGTKLFLKAENLQRIGAFKARGAQLAARRADPAARARGLVTYSSGNHAQAVALAAKTLGVPATIAMPENAPAVKVAAVLALGAKILYAGTTSPERKKVAEAVRAETGAVLIEPFDQLETIVGQGTATLELLDQTAARGVTLDALIVPVGGGGLSAGAALACQGSGIDIHTVEPEGCDKFLRSLAAGTPVTLAPAATLADGLRPSRVGDLNFEILRTRVTQAHTVNDEQLGRALVLALMSAKILLEPSGAAALALALRGTFSKYDNVGILCSGGNVDPILVAELLGRYSEELRAA